MTEIISREEAKAKGLNKYFTSKPCKNGHDCGRWICSGRCVVCQNLCTKRYRKKYPDRYHLYLRVQYKKHAEERRTKARKSRKKYPEKERARQLKYKRGNSQKLMKKKLERERKKTIALRILNEAAKHDPNLMKLVGEINDAVR